MSTIIDLVQWIVSLEAAQKENLEHLQKLTDELRKERERATNLQLEITRRDLREAQVPSA